MRDSSHNGFTLVELSIVLVILGLLVGGVLAGQSLIHAAELRKVSRDFTQYQAAINAFREKYLGLPGDLANATSFWGALHATPATCNTMAATGGATATCNGNGDGEITGNTSSEPFRFWQHLANAGLIEGRFSGVWDASASGVARGTNVPASSFAEGYYTIPNMKSDLFSFSGYSRTGKFLGIAGIGYMISDPIDGGGVLTHEDAWNIDSKMDDGTANTGNYRADITFDGDPVTNGSCSTYTLSNTTDKCFLGFKYIR